MGGPSTAPAPTRPGIRPSGWSALPAEVPASEGHILDRALARKTKELADARRTIHRYTHTYTRTYMYIYATFVRTCTYQPSSRDGLEGLRRTGSTKAGSSSIASTPAGGEIPSPLGQLFRYAATLERRPRRLETRDGSVIAQRVDDSQQRNTRNSGSV